MFLSRLVVVGQVDTGIAPPPDTARAARVIRREVVLDTGESNSSSSSNMAKAGQLGNNSKVRTGEVAVWGTTAASRRRICGSRTHNPTATANHGRRHKTLALWGPRDIPRALIVNTTLQDTFLIYVDRRALNHASTPTTPPRCYRCDQIDRLVAHCRAKAIFADDPNPLRNVYVTQGPMATNSAPLLPTPAHIPGDKGCNGE